MANTREIDVFTFNPFRNVRNTGYYKQKHGWKWTSDCDYACFYCITEGSVTVSLNGYSQCAQTGDVIFLKSGDTGASMSAEVSDAAYYFVSFYFDEEVDIGISTVVKNAGATGLFKDIRKAFHSETYLYKLKVAELFLQIVYVLSDATIRGAETYSASASLRTAVEYVNTNYYKSITVGDLCVMSGYSPSHLRRLFLKHYGLSPQDYITTKKLEVVKTIIDEDPQKSIEEIAELMSFCSASYLCKLFKKHCGMSISQYRAR